MWCSLSTELCKEGPDWARPSTSGSNITQDPSDFSIVQSRSFLRYSPLTEWILDMGLRSSFQRYIIWIQSTQGLTVITRIWKCLLYKEQGCFHISSAVDAGDDIAVYITAKGKLWLALAMAYLKWDRNAQTVIYVMAYKRDHLLVHCSIATYVQEWSVSVLRFLEAF